MKMMLCRVVFRQIISIVVSSFIPEYIKFFLCILFSKQITSHTPRFGSGLMDVFMCKAILNRVIGFNRSFWLGMIESFEHASNWDSKLEIAKHSCSFTFCCQRNNVLNNFACHQHVPIKEGRMIVFWMIAKLETSSYSASGFGQH